MTDPKNQGKSSILDGVDDFLQINKVKQEPQGNILDEMNTFSEQFKQQKAKEADLDKQREGFDGGTLWKGLKEGYNNILSSGAYLAGSIMQDANEFLGINNPVTNVQALAAYDKSKEIEKRLPEYEEYEQDSWERLAGNAVVSFVPTVAGVSLTAAGAPQVGAPLAEIGFAGLTASSAGGALKEYDEYAKQKGKDPRDSQLERYGVATAVGAIEYLTERMGALNPMIKKLAKSGAKPLLNASPEFTSQFGVQVLKDFATKNPAKWKAVMSTVGGSFGSEGSSEALAEFSQEAIANWYKENKDRSDIMSMVESSIQAGVVGGILGAGVGPLSFQATNSQTKQRREEKGKVTLGTFKDKSVEIIGQKSEDTFEIMYPDGKIDTAPVGQVTNQTDINTGQFYNVLKGKTSENAALEESRRLEIEAQKQEAQAQFETMVQPAITNLSNGEQGLITAQYKDTPVYVLGKTPGHKDTFTVVYAADPSGKRYPIKAFDLQETWNEIPLGQVQQMMQVEDVPQTKQPEVGEELLIDGQAAKIVGFDPSTGEVNAMITDGELEGEYIPLTRETVDQYRNLEEPAKQPIIIEDTVKPQTRTIELADNTYQAVESDNGTEIDQSFAKSSEANKVAKEVMDTYPQLSAEVVNNNADDPFAKGDFRIILKPYNNDIQNQDNTRAGIESDKSSETNPNGYKQAKDGQSESTQEELVSEETRGSLEGSTSKDDGRDGGSAELGQEATQSSQEGAPQPNAETQAPTNQQQGSEEQNGQDQVEQLSNGAQSSSSREQLSTGQDAQEQQVRPDNEGGNRRKPKSEASDVRTDESNSEVDESESSKQSKARNKKRNSDRSGENLSERVSTPISKEKQGGSIQSIQEGTDRSVQAGRSSSSNLDQNDTTSQDVQQGKSPDSASDTKRARTSKPGGKKQSSESVKDTESKSRSNDRETGSDNEVREVNFEFAGAQRKGKIIDKLPDGRYVIQSDQVEKGRTYKVRPEFISSDISNIKFQRPSFQEMFSYLPEVTLERANAQNVASKIVKGPFVPMSQEKVQAEVDKITKNWKNKPEIKVHESILDLQLRYPYADIPTDIPAMFYQGQVHIVASSPKFSNEKTLFREVEDSVLHESVGHYGFQGMMGMLEDPSAYRKEFDGLRDKIFEAAQNDALLDQIARNYFQVDKASELTESVANMKGMTLEEANRVMAEEYIAHRAQTGESGGIWDDVVTFFRKLYRELTGKILKLNDNEIRNIISRSKKFVKVGDNLVPKPDPIQMRPAYQRIDTSFGPVDIDSFSRSGNLYISAMLNGEVIGDAMFAPNGEAMAVDVDEEYQRQGIATAMYSHAKSRGLEVEVPNQKKNREVIRVNEVGESVVWENDNYYISVNDSEAATYATAWSKKSKYPQGDKIGFISVDNSSLLNDYGNNLKMKAVEVDKKHRGKGLGKRLYQALERYSADDVTGLISYLPDRINRKQVPSIYKNFNTQNLGDFERISFNQELRGQPMMFQRIDNGENSNFISNENQEKQVRQGEYQESPQQAFESAYNAIKRGAEAANGNKQEAEQLAARQYAEENDLLINRLSDLGEVMPIGGVENMIAVNLEDGNIYKSNNLFANAGSVLNFINTVQRHNALFPETQYELVGFEEVQRNKKPFLKPVVKQKFVADARQATPDEITDFMNKSGYERVNNHTFTGNGFTVSDMRPNNVLIDDEGVVYVVDNRIKEDRAMFQKAPSTESPAFKKWFGDSKVVDENGEPLVVYHGTQSKFTEFSRELLGTVTPGEFTSAQYAFFFTADRDTADLYSKGFFSNTWGDQEGYILPVYLKMDNPFYYEENSEDDRIYALNKANIDGHDGVIFTENGKPVNFGVFNPNQIKSAIGNIGTYDPRNNDIRFQRIAPVGTEAFDRWFGGSKMKDRDGNPIEYFHQTSLENKEPILNEGFDLSKIGSRGNDNYMPDGIFLKPDQSDIGVGATGDDAVQIPVYLSIKKPLSINTREDIVSHVDDKASKAIKASDDWDKTMSKRYEELEKPFYRDARHSDEKRKEAKKKMDKFFAEWRQGNRDTAEVARKEITRSLKEQGYDGLIVKKDEGSFGRETQTIVAFEPNQVKSSRENNGDFSSGENGIRFQRTSPRYYDPKDNFYSNSLRALQDIAQPKATGQQWKAMLLKNGASQAELDWIGFNQYISQFRGKSIEKDNILSFLRENQVEVQEVLKGTGEHERLAIIREAEQNLLRAQEEYETVSKPLVSKYGYRSIIDVKEGDEDVLDKLRKDKFNVDPIIESAQRLNAAEQRLREAKAGDLKEIRGSILKYTTYQLPGGENYKELLLTMPNKSANELERLLDRRFEIERPYLSQGVDLPEEVIQGEWGDINRQIAKARESKQPHYTSSHWDEPNILSHIRFNERSVNGERVLFIEELQSDWAQEGRKKGFVGDEKEMQVRNRIKEIEQRQEDILNSFPQAKEYNEYRKFLTDKYGEGFMQDPNVTGDEQMKLFDLEFKRNEVKQTKEFQEAGQEYKNLGEELRELNKQGFSNIPNMPFKRTQDWLNLSMRRMIRYASENGFDRIAFVNGQQSADRYDLSQQVDSIEPIINPDGTYLLEIFKDNSRIQSITAKEEELEGIVGKEIAEKIINDANNWKAVSKQENESLQLKKLSGLDLKVGGEGMINFYDKIVPNTASKLLKKLDKSAKVEPVEIETSGVEQTPPPSNQFAANAVLDELPSRKSTQLSFPITPIIKQTALQEGMPMFQRTTPLQTEGVISLNKWERTVEAIQDRFVLLNKLQKEKAPNIDEQMDAYNFENLSKGIVKEKIDQFRAKEQKQVEDSLKKMNKSYGVEFDEASRYLKAKHIVDDMVIGFKYTFTGDKYGSYSIKLTDGSEHKKLSRPEAVSLIGSKSVDLIDSEVKAKSSKNPEQEKFSGGFDGGGIELEEAKKIVRDFSRKVKFDDRKAFEKAIKDINQFILNREFATGLISKEKYDARMKDFKFYVPLRGFKDADYDPTVFTRDHKRKGRTSESGDPISYLLAMAQTSLEKGQQNLVKQRLLNFVQAYPDSRLYTIKNVWYAKENGQWNVYLQRPPKEVMEAAEEVKRNAPNPDNMSDEEYKSFQNKMMFEKESITVMVDGRKVAIEFNNPQIAKSLKSIDVNKAGAVEKYLGRYTRKLTQFYTQYSPEFALRNLIRDMTAGTLNIRNDFGSKVAIEVSSGVPKAMNTLRKGFWKNKFDGEEGKYLREFMDNGAMTGYSDLKDVTQLQEELKKSMELMKGNKVEWTKEMIAKPFKALDSVNRVFENAIRFSAFKTLRKRGWSKEKAAMYAKDLTVNFNRRGNLSNSIGSFYLFFNASVQGNARLLKPFADPKTRKRAIQTAIALPVVGAMLSVMNRIAGGVDDDDEYYYDKLPEYVRHHNILIPNFISDKPGDFFQIPLPYGFNSFFAFGDEVVRVALGKDKPADAALTSTLSLMNSFSPLGTPNVDLDDGVAATGQFLAPTIGKPFVDLMINRNFAGSQIYKEPYPGQTPKPDSEMYFASVNPIFREITRGLNSATGGDQEQSGWIDVNPETIEHLVGSYGGGIYSFAQNSFATGANVVTNGTPFAEDGSYSKVPIVRNYFKDTNPYFDQSLFYENAKDVKKIEDIYKSYLGYDRRKAIEFRKENIDKLKLTSVLDAYEGRIKKLKNASKTLKAKGRSTERLDSMVEELYKDFNKRYLTQGEKLKPGRVRLRELMGMD